MIVHRLKKYIDPWQGGGFISFCGEEIHDGRMVRGVWNHYRKPNIITCEKCLVFKPKKEDALAPHSP